MLNFGTASDYQKMLLMKFISSIGKGVLGIFVPIYLLELGYSLRWAVTFLVVHFTLIPVGFFLCGKISNQYGLKSCWFIRMLIFVPFLLLLKSLDNEQHMQLLALGVLWGLEEAFFWMPFNVSLVKLNKSTTTARAIAAYENVSRLAALLTPITSALIVLNFGFDTLFVVAAIISPFSLLPILSMKKLKTHIDFSGSKFNAVLQKNKSFILPEIIDNVAADSAVLLGIYVFISGLSILDIGALGSLGVLVGVAMNYVVALLSDRFYPSALMRFGAVLTSISWVFIFWVLLENPSPAMLYFVTFISGISFIIFQTPYMATMFNRSRGDEEYFLLLREIPTFIGRLILYSLAAIFPSFIPYVFLVSAILFVYFFFTDLEKLKT